jgi:hypothetical protein
MQEQIKTFAKEKAPNFRVLWVSEPRRFGPPLVTVFFLQTGKQFLLTCLALQPFFRGMWD